MECWTYKQKKKYSLYFLLSFVFLCFMFGLILFAFGVNIQDGLMYSAAYSGVVIVIVYLSLKIDNFKRRFFSQGKKYEKKV